MNEFWDLVIMRNIVSINLLYVEVVKKMTSKLLNVLLLYTDFPVPSFDSSAINGRKTNR
jgi:nicotinamide riboside transporter PnuC